MTNRIYKNTPCPDCGKLKSEKAELCHPCAVLKRAGETPAQCDLCSGLLSKGRCHACDARNTLEFSATGDRRYLATADRKFGFAVGERKFEDIRLKSGQKFR